MRLRPQIPLCHGDAFRNIAASPLLRGRGSLRGHCAPPTTAMATPRRRVTIERGQAYATWAEQSPLPPCTLLYWRRRVALTGGGRARRIPRLWGLGGSGGHSAPPCTDLASPRRQRDLWQRQRQGGWGCPLTMIPARKGTCVGGGGSATAPLATASEDTGFIVNCNTNAI